MGYFYIWLGFLGESLVGSTILFLLVWQFARRQNGHKIQTRWFLPIFGCLGTAVFSACMRFIALFVVGLRSVYEPSSELIVHIYWLLPAVSAVIVALSIRAMYLQRSNSNFDLQVPLKHTEPKQANSVGNNQRQATVPSGAPPAKLAESDEDALYAVAMREVESGQRLEGLWAKSFAKSSGVEATAKAMYIEGRVQILREESARDKLNQYCSNGLTPLMHAVKTLNISEVKGLVAKGADPCRKDASGNFTALDYAKKELGRRMAHDVRDGWATEPNAEAEICGKIIRFLEPLSDER